MLKWSGEIAIGGALGLALVALLTASSAVALPDRSPRQPNAAPAKAAEPSTPAKTLPPAVREGEIHFTPDAAEQSAVPNPFRLPEATFKFTETPRASEPGELRYSDVTFPSPVHTPQDANNTVHCECYRPAATSGDSTKRPACIVLHILGGDFALSRTFAAALAKRGVTALFVIMPYYGPRRDPNSTVRMISADPEETVRGMTQAVKDIRYATAWLAEQPDVDARQLGIFGISLGGITTALAAEAEPRLGKVCPVLAGGDIGSILWDAKEKHLAETRRLWEAKGGSRQSLVDLLSTVDPAHYADRLRDRKVLMLNANNDEVIPRVCTESLWQAAGKPPIVWYEAGHFSAAWYLIDALGRVTDFFQPDAADDAAKQAARRP